MYALIGHMASVGLRKLVQRLKPVSERTGREVNPHTFSQAEFRRKKANGDAFIANVLESPKIWIIGGRDELGAMG